MSHPIVLDFERPVVELERKIEELRGLSGGSTDLVAEIERLEEKAEALRTKVFDKLTPWQQVLLARHPERPRPHEVLDAVVEDFVELHGDRIGADDPGVIAGLGYCDRRKVAVLAHGRGRRRGAGRRHTALPSPSGLRKALRLVELAARFELPLINLLDVTDDGAADPRAAALGPPSSDLLAALMRLPSPTVAVVTGEAYGTAAMCFAAVDRLLMLRHAICAPVTPETCAMLELGDADRAEDAATALRLTAEDGQAVGFCDAIVTEPRGGAHRDPAACTESLLAAFRRQLAALADVGAEERIAARQARLETLGQLVAVSG